MTFSDRQFWNYINISKNKKVIVILVSDSEAYISESGGCGNLKICFWQFHINLNKWAKKLQNLRWCRPTLQNPG